jgi:hypothetical protein
MSWSQETTDAMQSWLASATANNWGPHEDDKLYSFVAGVWEDERSVWDEARTRELLQRKARELGSDPEDNHVAEAIQTGMSTGTTILEFLRHLSSQGQLSKLVEWG